jgi:acyl dehydratase
MTPPPVTGAPPVGTAFEPTPLTVIDARAVADYARASGDDNPIHLDADAARKAGLDAPIVHGMLMMGRLEDPVRAWLPGWHMKRMQLRFMRPLPVGDALSISGRVARSETRERTARLILRLMLRDGGGNALAVGEADLETSARA